VKLCITRLKQPDDCMKKSGFSLIAYRSAATMAGMLAPAFLTWRTRRQKEDPARAREKMAQTTLSRPDGSLVWIHCASVGEFNTALSLINAFSDAGYQVLITTVTLSSARLVAERLPSGAIHQFAPLDVPGFVNRFLDHWKPQLAVLVESELWPNTILALEQRTIPGFIVNGRMSDRSFRRWRRLLPIIRPVLASLEGVLCQSDEDTRRFRLLGASKATNFGNLKFDAATPPLDQTQLNELRSRIGQRPVFLAASVHPGEENAIIASHQLAQETFPSLLTIIAPRHPDKAAVFAEAATTKGYVVTKRFSAADTPSLGACDIHLVATLGELGLLYSVANLAFIGGSLIQHGGQNPIEAAKLAVPIVHGPHIGNFRDVYARLDQANAAMPIGSATDLPAAIVRLLSDQPLSIAMQHEASRLVRESTGALERSLDVLFKAIKPPDGKTAS
jgi:3-deoxy-D-manno-octulosonic-acid transferase